MSDRKDLFAGLLFIGLGAALGLHIYATLDIGTYRAMGPGYFPSRLSGLLILFGSLIALRAQPSMAGDRRAIAWRGLLTLTGSLILFGLSVEPLGSIPALAASLLLAVWASSRMTLAAGLTLTVTLVGACAVIFHWLLGTPLRLFGPWLIQ